MNDLSVSKIKYKYKKVVHGNNYKKNQGGSVWMTEIQ